MFILLFIQIYVMAVLKLCGCNCFLDAGGLYYFAVLIDLTFYDDLLQECENALVEKAQKPLIVGDLNSNLLQPSLPQIHVLVAMMKHLNLTELVGQPTRVTGSSHSQIDVVLTNVPDDFHDSTVSPCMLLY